MNILKLIYDIYSLLMLLKLKVVLVMDKEKNMQNIIKFNINVMIINGSLIIIKQQIEQYDQ